MVQGERREGGRGGNDTLSGVGNSHVTPDIITLGQQQQPHHHQQLLHSAAGQQAHLPTGVLSYPTSNSAHLVNSSTAGHLTTVPGQQQQHFHFQTSCGDPYSASPV